MFFQAGEIKGKPKEGLFAFSFQHSPAEEEQKELRGSLFAVIQVESNTKDEAETRANQLFANFKANYYEASGNNLKALEESLVSLENICRQQGAKIDLVAAVLWGSVAYVGKIGDGSVMLIRKGEAKKIDFSRVASGALYDKDDLLLLDTDLPNEVELNIISRAVKQDFEDSLRGITTAIREKTGVGLLVRLTIQEPIEKLETLLVADLDKAEKRQKIDKVKSLPFFGIFSPILPKIKVKIAEYAPVIKKVVGKARSLAREKIRQALEYTLEPWKPRKPGDIEAGHERRNKRIIQILVLLGAVLFVSVGVGLINSRISENRQNLEGGIAFVQNNLNEAESLKEINKAKASELVMEAEERLDTLPADNEKVRELKTRLAALLAEISRIYKADVSELADLVLVKGNIQSKTIRLLGNNIFVMDVGTGSVVKVATSGGEPLVFVGEKEGLQNIGLTTQSLYLQTPSAIKKVDLVSKEESDAAGPSKNWKKLISANTFSDNLYFLDAEAGQIWKYTSAGNILSGPQNYFQFRFEERPTAFAIDGAIYISSRRDIYKYIAGQKQNFQVKNLPRAFGSIVDLYTGQEASGLYILDKENGSVVVIDKSSGEYKEMYEDDRLKESDSLVVEEVKKRAYFLAGNKIYWIKLK